jgi:hypothetical protein
MSASKSILVVSMALAMLSVASGPVLAQVYGVWSNPTPQAMGTYTASGHLLLGDLTGLMGQIRTGVGDKMDVGLRLGFPDFDFDFGLAGDIHYRVMPASESLPMDLTATGGLGWTTLGEGSVDLSYLDVVFGMIASREVTTQTGFTLVPYGILQFDIRRVSVDVGSVSASDSEFGVHFGFGADVPVNEVLSVNGELAIITNGASAIGFQGEAVSDTAVFLVLGAGYHF